MMRGMLPRPAAVGTHLATTAGSNNPAFLATAYLEALTIWLITNPGIPTLAKDCHTNVSVNESIARDMASLST